MCVRMNLSLSRFLSGMMRLSHHNTVTGGTTHGKCTVHRPTVPPDGVPGFHQPDAQRVSQLVPPFEAAFQVRMAAWRMDGKPRTARRFTVYKPTVSIGVICAVVYTYGRDDGRIAPTRCAIIDAGL